jgi:hypothetical protein
MPYLHCPGCRLTIYEARMFAPGARKCPRCWSEMERKPTSLFRKPHRASRAIDGEVPSPVRKQQASEPPLGPHDPQNLREATS